MCKYCENTNERYNIPIYNDGWDGENTMIVLGTNPYEEEPLKSIMMVHIIVEYDNGNCYAVDDYIRLNYCPMCGRKL